MFESIPAKNKVILLLLLALIGLVIMILGIVRLYHESSQNSLLDSAKSTLATDERQNPDRPLLRDSTISTSTNKKKTFDSKQMSEDIYFQKQGTSTTNTKDVAIPNVKYFFYQAEIEIANFPPKLDIITTSKDDSRNNWIINNVTDLQLTASPLPKQKEFKIFCQNSSCDANLMGKGFCTDLYQDPTFSLPSKDGTTLESCQQGVAIDGFEAGFCGTCQYLVKLERVCVSIGVNQTSSVDKKTGKRIFDWISGTDQQNFIHCPPTIATKYTSGRKDDPNPEPASVNVTIVNQQSAAAQLNVLLWVYGPCSPFVTAGNSVNRQDAWKEYSGMPESAICITKTQTIFPSHGAGIALVFFGVVFILFGGVGAWYFNLQKEDAEYKSVPDGWRSTGTENGSFGAAPQNYQSMQQPQQQQSHTV